MNRPHSMPSDPTEVITDRQAAERALLSCILLDESQVARVCGIVSGSQFADEQLGQLFDLVIDRVDAGQPIEPAAMLEDSRRIFGKATAATLGELVSDAGGTHHAAYYAEKVAEASRNQLSKATLTEALALYDQPLASRTEIGNVIELALRQLRERAELNEVTKAYDAGLELVDTLVDLSAKPRRPIMFGIENIDRTVGGILPGELMTIAARPGGGKSTEAMQIARRTAERGRPVLFVSAEMTRLELIGRVLCGATETDARLIRQGKATAETLKALMKANEELETWPLFIADPPSVTVAQIRAMAKLQKARTGLDLVVVDYLGELEPADAKQDRRHQIGQMASDLKRLAKELEVAVIVLSQVNRGAQKDVPTLASLSESAVIEHVSDVVAFIHRQPGEGPNDPDEWKLIIAKHRHSSTGMFSIEFNHRRMEFTDPSPNYSWNA